MKNNEMVEDGWWSINHTYNHTSICVGCWRQEHVQILVDTLNCWCDNRPTDPPPTIPWHVKRRVEEALAREARENVAQANQAQYKQTQEKVARAKQVRAKLYQKRKSTLLNWIASYLIKPGAWLVLYNILYQIFPKLLNLLFPGFGCGTCNFDEVRKIIIELPECAISLC